MWVIGPKQVVFASESLGADSLRAVVAQLKAGVVSRPETRVAFLKLQKRFLDIKARLGAAISEISPDVVQFRKDLLQQLGADLREWPKAGRMGAQEDSRALLQMLMGLSMGAAFRNLLPAELRTLPQVDNSAQTLQDFHDHVLPFVIVEPAEPEYRWLIAQGLLADVVHDTVRHKSIAFVLRKNFAWDSATRTASAQYLFPQELHKVPAALAAGVGLSLGKVPPQLPQPDVEGLCKPCVESNNPDASPLDRVDSVNFAAEARNLGSDVSGLLKLIHAPAPKHAAVRAEASPAERASVAEVEQEILQDRPGQAFGTETDTPFLEHKQVEGFTASAPPPPPSEPPGARASEQQLMLAFTQDKESAEAAPTVYDEVPSRLLAEFMDVYMTKSWDEGPTLQTSAFQGLVQKAMDGNWNQTDVDAAASALLDNVMATASFSRAQVSSLGSMQAWLKLHLKLLRQAKVDFGPLVKLPLPPVTMFASSTTQAKRSLTFLDSYATGLQVQDPRLEPDRPDTVVDVSDEDCQQNGDKLLAWFLAAGLSMAKFADLAPGEPESFTALNRLWTMQQHMLKAGFLAVPPVQASPITDMLTEIAVAGDEAELAEIFRRNKSVKPDSRCVVDSSRAANIRTELSESRNELFQPAQLAFLQAWSQLVLNRDPSTAEASWNAMVDDDENSLALLEPEQRIFADLVTQPSISVAAFTDTMLRLLRALRPDADAPMPMAVSSSALRKQLSTVALAMQRHAYSLPASIHLAVWMVPVIPLVLNGRDARDFVYIWQLFQRAVSSQAPALAIDRFLARVMAPPPTPANCGSFDTDLSVSLASRFVDESSGLNPNLISQMLQRPSLLDYQRTLLERLRQDDDEKLVLSDLDADYGQFDFGDCLLTGPVTPSARNLKLLRHELFTERKALEDDSARAQFKANFESLSSEFDREPTLDRHQRLCSLEYFARYSYSEYVSCVHRQLRRMKKIGQVYFDPRPLRPVVVDMTQGEDVVKLTRAALSDPLNTAVPSLQDEVRVMLQTSSFRSCTNEVQEFAAMLTTQLFCMVAQADAGHFEPAWARDIQRRLQTYFILLPRDDQGFFYAAHNARTPKDLFALVQSRSVLPTWTKICQ
jgi:hypothetical protein